jgi:SHS2 domain-containing protein
VTEIISGKMSKLQMKRKTAGREKTYRDLDHTADIGVEVYGRTLPELFENCARALFDHLADTRAVQERKTVAVAVAAPDLETLLVTFLNELLHTAEEGGLVLKSCSVTKLEEQQVTAEAHGEPFDPARHQRLAEIKTTTYHQLKVMQQNGTWTTPVIFDV